MAAGVAEVGCIYCLGFGYRLSHIWIAKGRPTNRVVEAETCGNGAIHDSEAYTVSPSSADWEDVMLDSRIF